MTKLCLQPLFLLGLIVRFILIVIITPLAVSDWFGPFLDLSTVHFTLDPWTVWLNGGGTPVAFPYGYAMWLGFLPLSIAAKLIGFPLKYAYDFTLLAADFALLLVFRQLLPNRDRLLLITYWLSPIVLFASYGLGFNDLIPVLLLSLSLYFTRHLKLKIAGVVYIAAISAKLSMALALPFFLIYLFNKRSLRQVLPQFLIGMLLGAILLILPFLFSNSGLLMLFSNPEMDKVYRLVINIGGDFVIYAVPLMYFLMLYRVWRVPCLNYDLFHATLGLAFLLIVLMTPASPGWFIWAIPLLVTYQFANGKIAIALVGLFSIIYVLSSLLTIPIMLSGIRQFDLINVFHLSKQLSNQTASFLHTAMVAMGIILVMRIWRETVSRNDFFRLSQKPFVMGISGDSGAGKDTFSDAIKGLFGSHSVTTLSGDDYHHWDRQKPMWQVMTHLNPMANDLEGFTRDLFALADGKSIHARHYEHQTGRMSRPFKVKSNDIIIASGLHALYLPTLRDCYNLSIYLDIDEDLRRHFKLQRDVHQRGHTLEKVLSSFEKREPDSMLFIRPQASHADLVLSLQPIHANALDSFDEKQPLRFKIVVRSCNGFNEHSLIRVLVGMCGLHVDMVVSPDGSKIELTIEGDTSAQDVALAAQMICPRVIEFLDIYPKWQDGIMGLMQLITLSHVNQALTKRLI